MRLYCNTIFYRITLVMIMDIELNLKQLLAENNRTKYWLVKKLETDYRFATKLLENETKSITFQMIGRLCEIFECTPNDLFVIKDTEEENE